MTLEALVVERRPAQKCGEEEDGEQQRPAPEETKAFPAPEAAPAETDTILNPSLFNI